MSQHPIVSSPVKVQQRGKQLPILTTERLTIRDILVEDISDEYVAWLNNPEITKNLELRFTPQTRKSVTDYIKAKLADTVSGQHYGVYDQQGSRLVGTVSLGAIDPHHKGTDISFIIGHPDAQGLGYGTEAVHAVTHYALCYGVVIKIWAGYYDGHHASANVLAKNGYEVEGRIRKKYINSEGRRVDHILVGILADEYQTMHRQG